MIVSEPLDRVLYDRPHYARQGFDYWQQLPDGRILLGGFRDVSILDELTDVEETTPAIQASLERSSTSSTGEDVRITHRWAGIFGLTQDLLPLVGRVPGRDGRSGSPAATPATATCSASPAARSSPTRFSARVAAARAARPGALLLELERRLMPRARRRISTPPGSSIVVVRPKLSSCGSPRNSIPFARSSAIVCSRSSHIRQI